MNVFITRLAAFLGKGGIVGFIWGAALAMTAGAIDISPVYQGTHFAWGAETNQFQAGLVFDDETNGPSIWELAQVLVVTSKTNAMWEYISPPGGALRKVELKTADGMNVIPAMGTRLDGKLPGLIPVADLPQTFHDVRHNALPLGVLPLAPNQPAPLKEFVIQDTFQIQKEADYLLSVWPSVYQMATNRETVTRMDLPPVSIKIHLKPSIKK